jgi:3D (Asp-Asp-Asp) domain-containing protein
MSKPLLGGGAAAAALLSASLLFYAQPSVAETLAVASQDTQQKGDATETQNQGAVTAAPAERGAGVAVEKENRNAAVENAATLKNEESAPASSPEEAPSPALRFTATAYSLRGRTASGAGVRRGLIAADRRVLPIGTRVRLEAGAYSGEYLVADTGGAVRGRKIDIWMPSTSEAMRFGRRSVKLTVLSRVRPRTAPAKRRV